MAHGVVGSIFETYIEGVRVKYQANVLAPTLQTPHWKIGRLNSRGQASAPSVQWRRLGGTVEATTRPGIQNYTSTGGDPVFFIADWDSIDAVEMRVRAADWQQLDCVWGGLLTAVRDTFGAMGIPGGYEHLSEAEDDDPAAAAQKGVQELVQSWTFRLPIPRVQSEDKTVIDTIIGTTRLIDTNPDPGTAGPTITQPLP